MFTFESRGPASAPAGSFGPTRLAREAGPRASQAPQAGPRGELQRRWRGVEELARRLGADEAATGLPPTRPLDPGFSQVAHGWAAGDDLSRIIADEDVSGGDFVRNVKQLIDLLRQVGDVAPTPATASAARSAADALFRGVVAASSTVGGHVGGHPRAPGGAVRAL